MVRGSDHAGWRSSALARAHELGDEVVDSAPTRDVGRLSEFGARSARVARSGRSACVCGTASASDRREQDPGVRCALVHDTFTASRAPHNDANVIALGARVIGPASRSRVTRSATRSTAAATSARRSARRARSTDALSVLRRYEDKVIETRVSKDGSEIRRRRECEGCARRYTTYERIEESMPLVVKNDGRASRSIATRSSTDPPRSPSAGHDEQIRDRRASSARSASSASEIASRDIGERVLPKLRALDQVAYVRFASIYRDFRDLEGFAKELDALRGEDTGRAPTPSVERRRARRRADRGRSTPRCARVTARPSATDALHGALPRARRARTAGARRRIRSSAA